MLNARVFDVALTTGLTGLLISECCTKANQASPLIHAVKVTLCDQRVSSAYEIRKDQHTGLLFSFNLKCQKQDSSHSSLVVFNIAGSEGAVN